FYALDWHVGQRLVVFRSFDDHFVSADAVHLVEHALGLAINVALDTQCWKLVGDHAHAPAGRIGQSFGPSIGHGTIAEHFRGRLAFVSRAEGTEAAFHFHGFANKVGRALGAVGRNNDPTASNGIFSQLRQLFSSSYLEFILRHGERILE